MTSRRFFAIIWRINALFLLLVCFATAILLILAALSFYRDTTRERPADDVAKIISGVTANGQATLGDFDLELGATILRAPLRIAEPYSGIGSGSREQYSIRNYLFYDAQSRQSYWLKPSMDSLIAKTIGLPEGRQDNRKESVSTYVYAIVDKDTNGDGNLTESDGFQIAVSSVDGTNLRILAEKVDRINDARLLSADRLLILYSVGSKLFSIELNPQKLSSEAAPHEIHVPSSRK